MKRSPLKRKTPLKRTGFLKRGKPLAKTSPKRRQEMPQMRAWHDAVFERDGDMCVFFPELRGIIAHHIKSRQAWPGLKFDVKNGLRVSQYGHDWAHAEKKDAKEWLRTHRPEQYEHLYGDKT